MLATIGAVAAVNAIDKQQRKNNKPSFLDKKITKACASAICPGAGQFLDGRTKEGAIHFAAALLCDVVARFGPRGMAKYLENFLNKGTKLTPLGLGTWNFVLIASRIGQVVTRIVSASNAYILSKEK